MEEKSNDLLFLYSLLSSELVEKNRSFQHFYVVMGIVFFHWSILCSNGKNYSHQGTYPGGNNQFLTDFWTEKQIPHPREGLKIPHPRAKPEGEEFFYLPEGEEFVSRSKNPSGIIFPYSSRGSLLLSERSENQPSAGAGVQGAEPPEGCMIHTIVYYVGNFIPDWLALHKFTTMGSSGIKFPTGPLYLYTNLLLWARWEFYSRLASIHKLHFYYIEETNSHTSVYYTNYMGIVFPITT